ncbi:class I SAM-dependent methyltransferase [Nocardia jinanensis]|uniref:Methyltransferase n=1 Tax=Nocardia jinanensis TaxID=382504 RepID=A0A917VRK1_9NOCA|nr:class I SAM-dependent methyltransferase [Nocardia jinanensis]GGL07312.1 methyltransferase [Nocardia jinanensis]
MTNADREQRPSSCDYDAELRRHDDVLRRAGDLRFHDRILDIGCGSGHTTRQAARTARAGSALGVDISASAIDRARELADRLPNVTFEQADAQVHRFPHEYFDVAISRFGTMFFGDPAAAFANIGRALRPDGRLVMLVWQAGERNEWDVAIRRALGEPRAAAAPPPAGPDPFSLADPMAVLDLLDGAGFADISFTDVREPVYYGPDPDTALDWVRGFTCTANALGRLGPADAAHAIARLRTELAAHRDEDGVRFDSRAWIVSARRARAGNHGARTPLRS